MLHMSLRGISTNFTAVTTLSTSTASLASQFVPLETLLLLVSNLFLGILQQR